MSEWVYHIFASYHGDYPKRHVWDGVIQRGAPISNYDDVRSLKEWLWRENFTECRSSSAIVIESISLILAPYMLPQGEAK